MHQKEDEEQQGQTEQQQQQQQMQQMQQQQEQEQEQEQEQKEQRWQKQQQDVGRALASSWLTSFDCIFSCRIAARISVRYSETVYGFPPGQPAGHCPSPSRTCRDTHNLLSVRNENPVGFDNRSSLMWHQLSANRLVRSCL